MVSRKAWEDIGGPVMLTNPQWEWLARIAAETVRVEWPKNLERLFTLELIDVTVKRGVRVFYVTEKGRAALSAGERR